MQIKKDPALIVFSALLVLVVAGLVWHGDVSWKEAAAFLGAALGFPAMVGRNQSDSSTDVDVEP